MELKRMETFELQDRTQEINVFEEKSPFKCIKSSVAMLGNENIFR
jgi:hypothetical protein